MRPGNGLVLLNLRVGDRQPERLQLLQGLVKPGLTSRNAANVLNISPELTSRTSASAICATTRMLRARCRSRLDVAVRPPPRRARATRPRRYLNTRVAPNSSPAATDTTSVNANVPVAGLIVLAGPPSAVHVRTSYSRWPVAVAGGAEDLARARRGRTRRRRRGRARPPDAVMA